MYIEKIDRKLPPLCDERDCINYAVYEIHVAIFGIKLCKKCMEELVQQYNKLIS